MPAIAIDSLTATYLEESHRWGDTAILRCEVRAEKKEAAILIADEEIVTVKCFDCEEDELDPGMPYTFYGTWEEYHPKPNKWNRHPEMEMQFHAKQWHKVRPYDKRGVIKWLKQCPGIMEGIAQRLWAAFGPDAIQRLKDQPEQVAEEIGGGFTEEKARKAAAHLHENERLEAVFVDLGSLLDGRGFSHTLQKKLVRDHGGEAAEKIKKNPWLLLQYRSSGVSRVDKLFLDMGGRPDALKRQAIILWHCLLSAGNVTGDTWQREAAAKEMLRSRIGGTELRFPKAVELAVRGGLINLRWDGNLDLWLAEGKRAKHEQYVAKRVAEILVPHATRLAKYAQVIEQKIIKVDHTKCTRCHRTLTAAMVAIMDDNPYGPECITKISGGEDAEKVELAEWLDNRSITLQRIVNRHVGFDELKTACEWPDVATLDLSDHQRERLATVFSQKLPLLILGGAPGTGKTYTAARVIDALAKSIGIDNIAAAAPTGKAAVRLTEILDGYGIPLRATTEHKMLGVAKTPEVGGWGFCRNEDLPFDIKMLVLDEMSMNDIALTAAVFRALVKGTRIVLIGDYNQLPPVGPGRPLYDLIQAGVPYADFREIQRNAGTIVRACAAIRDGNPIPWDDKLELNCVPPRNLKLISTRNNKESLESLLGYLRALSGKMIPINLKDPDGPRRSLDPVWDIQVLAATNGLRRGFSEISRVELNKVLQNELNPTGEGMADSVFRIGDKVMNLKNSWAPCIDSRSTLYDPAANQEKNEDGEIYVANGEIGRVIGQEPKLLYVKLDAPYRLLKIPKGRATATAGGEDDSGDEEAKTNTGCNWDLAYACTIHKYQGSEVPIVLFPIDDTPTARMVMSREALLTAWSRAKWFCCCFGKASVVELFRQRSALAPRKTFLTESIVEEIERLKEEAEKSK
ncbi:MAG: AAA family ATPase [Planctomycetota bacterium]